MSLGWSDEGIKIAPLFGAEHDVYELGTVGVGHTVRLTSNSSNEEAKCISSHLVGPFDHSAR